MKVFLNIGHIFSKRMPGIKFANQRTGPHFMPDLCQRKGQSSHLITIHQYIDPGFVHRSQFVPIFFPTMQYAYYASRRSIDLRPASFVIMQYTHYIMGLPVYKPIIVLNCHASFCSGTFLKKCYNVQFMLHRKQVNECHHKNRAIATL